MSYILGIDVGGTKYHARARKLSGAQIDITTVSNGNLHALGPKKMAAELTKLVRAMQRKLRTRENPDAVCLGISGLDDPATTRALMRALSSQSWWKSMDANRRYLANDIHIGMRAGTNKKHGIAIISGTGSNGYGLDPKGEEATVSGRGLWLADEGGGAQIGIDALHAARRAEDGRGTRTKLEKMIYKHFGVQSTDELVPIVEADTFQKRDFAALNNLVETAAEAGDKVARKILDHAIDELLLMTDTLHKRLNFGREVVDTALIGGTINRNQYVLRGFLRGARKRKWMQPLALPDDPVAGAIKIAAGE